MGFINTDASSSSKGRDAVATNKSDMSLPQSGGEGGGKEGKIMGKNDDLAFHPHVDVEESYTGKGRDLKIEQF